MLEESVTLLFILTIDKFCNFHKLQHIETLNGCLEAHNGLNGFI